MLAIHSDTLIFFPVENDFIVECSQSCNADVIDTLSVGGGLQSSMGDVIVSFLLYPYRRLLHAMYQAKVDEAVQQAKALQKAMASGKLAEMVRIGAEMSSE